MEEVRVVVEEDGVRFRGGLVCKAHRLLYHSTLGLRVTQKKKSVLYRGTSIIEDGVLGRGTGFTRN